MTEHGVPVSAQADRKRLYIAADDHTDYLWTADEATYRRVFQDMLDYYLDLADATAGELPEYQSRWNCDGSLWMWTYEKNKPAADFSRLIERIRSGHVSVPLNALCVCLGGAPAEAVLRGMYYPGQIERRHNLRFSLAYTVENQTQPYGLSSLWAGSGVKYSWKGICGCATRVTSPGDREHEIYWSQGPDGSRVLMKWYSLVNNQSLGGYAEALNPGTAIELMDAKCYSASYNYGIAGAFGHGWDGLEAYTDQFPTVAKQRTNASRQVVVSNETDFFQDFEATYGAGLPTVAASFGNEWELYCASLAEVSARIKRAVEKLRSAEALATLVSLQTPAFTDGRQAARDQAWMNLGLYWEHDWTADGPISRAIRRDWQRRITSEVESYVNALYTDAAVALGGMIRKSGTNLRFYAFNPLGWTRTDIADVPYPGAWPVHVVDLTTGQETPSQLVTLGGQSYLRILAQAIPSVGYKAFEVRAGAGQTFADAPTADAATGVIANGIYQASVAPRGAITSLKDKTRSDREFARNIGGYYINDLGTGAGSLAVENAGPVSVTLRATSSSPLAHTTRVTLFRGLRRVDIRNEITQNFADVRSWRFSLNLDAPDTWHEEVGAVIRAKLLAAGGHYSPRNARYDWLTLNHFADMTGSDGAGVTLSNADCYYMKLGNSTASSLDTATPQISPLIGGQVDGTGLGIQDQGGETYFQQRFALETHGAFDPLSAMRSAVEHQNPLVTGVITGGAAYPETSLSLLTVSNPDVLLWALKPSEEGIGQGIIARLWNLSGSAASVNLAMPGAAVASAQETTHIETPIGSATVSAGVLSTALAARQMRTFNLKRANNTYIPLVAGWNLIGLPLAPDDDRPEVVFAPIAGQYDAVYAYDACGTSPAWLKYVPDAPPFVSSLSTVSVQQGLWCHAISNTTFGLAGAAVTDISIPLCAGWNLIAYPCAAPIAVPDALASIAGKYLKVTAYDASDALDPWKRYDVNAPPPLNDLTVLEPGKGYWIEMLEPATLSVVS
jgi:alpha-mannosidase